MSDTPHQTKSITCTGCELDAVLQHELADGWKLVAQSTLGAGDFELTFARKTEGQS